MKIKRHITGEELIDLIYEKLNIANPNLNNLIEYANRLDLIFDEEKEMYLNPKWNTPEEFLVNKYNHNTDYEKGKFGFYEVISIIEEYVRDYK